MKWVLRKLKSILRTEQMIGTRHYGLQGDPKYKISAEFAKDRIPQLNEAIKVLENYKDPIESTTTPATERKLKKTINPPNQLNLFS